MRSEQEIFDELTTVCSSPGYVHALAYLCFREDIITYAGNLTAKDLEHSYSKSRLIRTETTTLIGLLIKQDIDFAVPSTEVFEQYIDRTVALLHELHVAMTTPMFKGLNPEAFDNDAFPPATAGAWLREPIFYGGESAYSFQYRDFAPNKYANDEDWLLAHKGFTLKEVRTVALAIEHLLEAQALGAIRSVRKDVADPSAFLPVLTFSAENISQHSKLNVSAVETILSAFAIPVGTNNAQFKALNDFNAIAATPFVPTQHGNYLLFHIYGFLEAMYETPYYWMGADKAYVATAMTNRGLFTEQFANERLQAVFGKERVFPNVKIYEGNGKGEIGEIDVLVLFGNRAIVLQAKSKRLTLEARRGNDLQIKDDFKKSVQNSCDQAYACAGFLPSGNYQFKDATGKALVVPSSIGRVYVVCLVADHYPALSFQARQFLTFTPADNISPPLVTDVFMLDATAEMLSSPLRFLSYLDRRTGYADRLSSSHELTILSYHLKRNLWLNSELDFVLIDDDVGVHLDVAMHARRQGVPGRATPEGILTRFSKAAFGRILDAIERRSEPAVIDLGFMLLTLGEDTVKNLSLGVDRICKEAARDGQNHDFTATFGRGNAGLTIHCNERSDEMAAEALQRHCLARKYVERANAWFGLCLRPDQSIRFGYKAEFKWVQSDDMDELCKGMRKSDDTDAPRQIRKERKVGRNDPCPCGSGKKYKKCCLDK
jgi:SEC-C motif/Nuclease-related domain